MRIGAIDIGTNTILLLIADVQQDGSLKAVRDEHAIARLGKGVDAHRNIQPDAFKRAVEFLLNYRAIIERERVDTVTVCATSFLRDAQNRQEFIEHVRRQVGFNIRVLSGDEEGTLTYLGAVSEFRKHGSKQEFAVLDIGGGSTELSTGTNSQVVQRTSLDIGSVRLTERILKTSPPAQGALDEAKKHIETHVKRFGPLSPNAQLIGVAGTLTTLAAMDIGLQQYDRTAVSGHTLSIDSIRAIFNELRMKTLDELKRYPQILPERADILVGGILILLETLTALQRREIIASDRGLRYGMVAETASTKP